MSLQTVLEIPYCIDFLGRKINLSRISQAKRSRSGPNSVSYVDNQGVTAFRELWARSAHFGQNGGWDESRGTRVFLFGKPRDFSATSQRPIFTKFGHETYFCVPSRNPFLKIFTSGVIFPQNLKSKIGQTGTSLRAGYRSRDTLQRYSVCSTL